MSRNFSASLNALINSQEFDQVLLKLVSIEHDGGVLRYVNGYEEITSNLRTFNPAPFKITMPDENDDSPPSMSASFDVGDTQFVNIIRTNSSKPRVFLEMALRDNPDTIEIGPLTFFLSDYTIQNTAISVNLQYEPILREPMPGNSYTPYIFQQLF